MPKATKKTPANQAFTLIELSIVLVIIGLIVGGILVGQNMILAAQVRKDISTMEKFSTATATFRSKYNCIPGDCANATGYSFDNSLTGVSGYSACINGNGNGQVNYGSGGCTMAEQVFFLSHLTQANLIEGISPQLAVPHGPKGGSYIASDFLIFYAPELSVYSSTNFVSGFSRHVVAIQAGYATTNTAFINPTVAYMYDMKMDDGMPFTGNARIQWYYTDGIIGSSYGSTGANCRATVNGQVVYDTSQTGFTCSLMVGLAF